MSIKERECQAMLRAAERGGIKLMVAYCLHFEQVNMTVVELLRSGKLGNSRFFASSFSMQVRRGNICMDKKMLSGAATNAAKVIAAVRLSRRSITGEEAGHDPYRR
jgi:glucose-fructose oxidoreductase